jgi:putative aldouronate transport system permease protein
MSDTVKKKKIAFRKLELIKNWKLYMLAVPALAIFFVFAYLPMPGIILAFKKYTIQGGIYLSDWVGFDNFSLFFKSSDILRLTRNVLVLNLSGLVLSTVFTVLCAILLNQLFSGRMQKTYQNILFLPYFFSALIMVRFAYMFFDDNKGLVNMFLQFAGLRSYPFSQNATLWVPIVVVTSLVKGLGYGIIVYLATITGMDTEIYEAARIDGAGRLVQTFRITLPLLAPTIVLIVLMSIGRMFYGDFIFVYAFVGDNYVLKERLDIIETYLFRNLTGSNLNATPDYGLNAAVGLYQSVLGFVMIFLSNFIVRRFNKDMALF